MKSQCLTKYKQIINTINYPPWDHNTQSIWELLYLYRTDFPTVSDDNLQNSIQKGGKNSMITNPSFLRVCRVVQPFSSQVSTSENNTSMWFCQRQHKPYLCCGYNQHAHKTATKVSPTSNPKLGKGIQNKDEDKKLIPNIYHALQTERRL